MIIPWYSHKIKAITFPAEETLLNFLWGGKPGYFHCMLCFLESGSNLVDPSLILGHNSVDKFLRVIHIARQGYLEYLEISSLLLFWSSANILGNKLGETLDKSVRIVWTTPKLMPTSLAISRRFYIWPDCANSQRFHLWKPLWGA